MPRCSLLSPRGVLGRGRGGVIRGHEGRQAVKVGAVTQSMKLIASATAGTGILATRWDWRLAASSHAATDVDEDVLTGAPSPPAWAVTG
jgi:hypothetical protein